MKNFSLGNSVNLSCQRAIFSLLCIAGISACGQPATTPTPTTSTVTQVKSEPVSQSQSAPIVETKPAVDPKAACKVAPKQASMFLVQAKAGITNGAMIPSGAKVITDDKPAGPGTRAVIFSAGGKDFALRYSFPDGKQFPAEKNTKIDIGRTKSNCTLGQTDGWRISDSKGVLAIVDAGGCAPAYAEEPIPGLKIVGEDVGCEAKSADAIERACAVKIITKDKEELLAPGESRVVELEKGKFHVSAGLCAWALREDLKKGSGGRRGIADFRISYAILRVNEPAKP
jgi:hypothetical protein